MGLLILDRDGVINEDSDQYIRNVEQWRPISGSIEAIARFSRQGYDIAIATNQSGLSRGYFGLDELESIHAELCNLVEAAGGRVAGVFYCPHLPGDDCNCRKPRTGLLEAIEQELGQSLPGAYFIGDSLKDLQAARSVGCTPILVRTGKGRITEAQLQEPDVDIDLPGDIPIYDNLAQAATQILSV